MGGIGAPELLLVFAVVLIVFGPKKIPEVARALGRIGREFRRLTTEFQRELNLAEALEESEKSLSPSSRERFPAAARAPKAPTASADPPGPPTPAADPPAADPPASEPKS